MSKNSDQSHKRHKWKVQGDDYSIRSEFIAIDVPSKNIDIKSTLNVRCKQDHVKAIEKKLKEEINEWYLDSTVYAADMDPIVIVEGPSSYNRQDQIGAYHQMHIVCHISAYLRSEYEVPLGQLHKEGKVCVHAIELSDYMVSAWEAVRDDLAIGD